MLLIHDGKVDHRDHVILGGVLAGLGLLALLHILAGPDYFPGNYDEVKEDGGWVAGSRPPLRRSSATRCDRVTVALLLAALRRDHQSR